jgi:hypothetical protein
MVQDVTVMKRVGSNLSQAAFIDAVVALPLKMMVTTAVDFSAVVGVGTATFIGAIGCAVGEATISAVVGCNVGCLVG